MKLLNFTVMTYEANYCDSETVIINHIQPYIAKRKICCH